MADFQLRGMPVWVYAKDVDTKSALTRARLIDGYVGETFSIDPESIPGYRFVSSEGTLTGTFDEQKMYTTTFYYQREDVAETEKLTHKYLHIFANIQPVVGVEDATETGQKLWAGSVVKVAQRMATRTGDFWYQLADSRWLKYDMQTMKLTDNDGHHQQPVAEWKRPTVWQPTPFSAHGKVDYIPGADVAVYSQPYGHEIGRIQHGVSVEITEQVVDLSGVTWYHVAQQGWLSNIYLSLNI